MTSMALCAMALFGMASIAVVAAEAGQPMTVNAGVFSPAQAERGRLAYQAHCAACHGETLTGEGAPALAGPFWTAWSGRSLDELYLLVQGSMPQQAPESLPPETYADIIAYMLRIGGYPSGSQPLPADEAEIAAIRIEQPK